VEALRERVEVREGEHARELNQAHVFFLSFFFFFVQTLQHNILNMPGRSSVETLFDR